jgi:translation initiation factor IF-1
MVKNTTGGNKSKKISRKVFNSNLVREKTRVKNHDEPFEMYASVIKHSGNGIVEVMCLDEIKRNCIIRNKFRGRNKRNNFVTIGTKILVGLRDYETISSTKTPKCDLLYVYKDYQIKDIISDINKNTDSNWDILVNGEEQLNKHQPTKTDINDDIIDDTFEFAYSDESNTPPLTQPSTSTAAASATSSDTERISISSALNIKETDVIDQHGNVNFDLI